ncbi:MULTISPECIES: tRNA dihydrouridine synthase DusB [Methylobacterium]|uniref:tRNA-dihydrouridine synthase n=3 Tax=Pseudomonadota TaxID=1224 RepID=A0ABQ4STF8_9HYPH|nr:MULTISPECIES: tRNA dihydrouridine synthase DusB [Methylobacterium]PIU08565.1 MAG: tRNA dihydrouridine synthase DusB [Methylobacterium sp. CG09_land_8_20_14_0_10_71_15]PIU11368.1 MAG: tRNA dihydrouridine synthase DusB [Methylobacterium sp. CG08_land_8_20_14_0_20_71_15]GJE05779.1 tRNA-dihydrouridine synthase B [Methylobacterium jeotgali]
MSSDDYLSFLREGKPAPAGAAAVLLAPLSGVTDLHMRRIARRLGASAVVSEMVAAAEFARGGAEARLRAEGSGVDPHVVQLAGCAPEPMAEAARLAEANGAGVIDVNMGCPAKTVTGGESGSALMRDLDHAERLLAAVRGAVAVPVTVKMRLGWDHASLNAPELARRAEGLGLSAVTVHGRTRQQFYKGRADWAAIRAVVEAVRIPVIANGDVGSLAEARECLAVSGAAGVMIGRAAVGRPWLVGEIAAGLAGRVVPPLAPERRAEIALEHYAGLLALYGPAIGIRHARKHLAAYVEAAGSGLGPADQTRLLTTQDPGLARDLLRRALLAPAAPAAIGAAA